MQQKLAISSTKEIYDQYIEAGEAIEAWATEHHKSQPRDSGGILAFHPTMKDHELAAQELFPTTHIELERLRDLIREHIATLEDSAYHASNKAARRGMPQGQHTRLIQK
jgi:hypothetical protein